MGKLFVKETNFSLDRAISADLTLAREQTGFRWEREKVRYDSDFGNLLNGSKSDDIFLLRSAEIAHDLQMTSIF